MLPGKLCIGILEEDNPLKSYFRLKPLLAECEGKYEVIDVSQLYPEEGCIRIVPDKNESSHFKARMRRMGRYCVLDLREHAGENDKIRPNKNYHGDESEKNAHIVYSDVVREPAQDMIFEIVEIDCESGIWEGNAPGTPRVISGDGLETWRYLPSDEGEQAHIEKDGLRLIEEEIQRFDLPGFSGETLHIAIRLPGAMASVIGVPMPKAESAPAEAKPAAEVRPAAKPQAAPEAEKPWLSREHMPSPSKAPQGGLSPLEQTLAAQSGLNPRRNRSLQEIIEEKWRHSRVDQLGHPIPVHAMGKPVESPIESAVEALRSAWSIPEIQDQLLEAITAMPEFSRQLDSYGKQQAAEARRRELEDMEADRLKALDALDKLRRDKAALRESFKQEIRQEEAAAFRDAVARTKEAQAECKKYETMAAEARRGAEMAQDAFASLNDGRFEEKLKDFALTSRAAELLAHPVEELEPLPPAENLPTRGEWMLRIKRALEAEGMVLNDIQAANLLVCAALGESLIFSGAAASDKLGAARALANAMGNCCEIPVRGRFDAGSAAVVLLPNANAVPGADLCRGLCAPQRRVLAVVADAGAGHPISPEDLERGFMIRMEAPASDAPWRPLRAPAADFEPASPAALRKAMLDGVGELPEALERRLQRIRSALGLHGVRLSRHTLDAMWRFCAAMLNTVRISPADALDLAFSQKALPVILAEAPLSCLAELGTMLADMPRCLKLLEAPLPVLV